MKKMMQGFFLLLCLLMVIFVWTGQQQPTAAPKNTHTSALYAEELSKKLQATNFTQQVIEALREAGYSPDSTIGYLIDSPNYQIITIQLHDGAEIDKSAEGKIQSIINKLTATHHMHPFIVNIELLEIN
ncbi:hypothetical protein ACIQVU_08705 [Lysinibacillus sp. NPDC098008]|uniref:hypothetical protein n=1 Tax=Lysinibacillus sp. NPDC098008 TaxID=3364146 RepID=UPI0037FB1058